MANKSKFSKAGVLRVENGTTERNGRTVKCWSEIGTVYTTPHHSQVIVRLNASAYSESRLASIFWDRPPQLTDKKKDDGKEKKA
jgi:hypothetical protein